MLPLALLQAAQAHTMLVELKNGDTYNGMLDKCDTWMNISLKDVICTSRDGDKFWHLAECYIRGNTIKYLRITDEVIDKVADDEKQVNIQFNNKGRGRGRGAGGRGGRGKGKGGKGEGKAKGKGNGKAKGSGKAKGKGKSNKA